MNIGENNNMVENAYYTVRYIIRTENMVEIPEDKKVLPEIICYILLNFSS